jgi:hypothetical protein
MPSCKPNANQTFDNSKTNLQVQVVCTFFSISMDKRDVLGVLLGVPSNGNLFMHP